jgi:hypothetical protein
MSTYDIIIGFTRLCSEWMSRRRCGRSLILTDRRKRHEVSVKVRGHDKKPVPDLE